MWFEGYGRRFYWDWKVETTDTWKPKRWRTFALPLNPPYPLASAFFHGIPLAKPICLAPGHAPTLAPTYPVTSLHYDVMPYVVIQINLNFPVGFEPMKSGFETRDSTDWAIMHICIFMGVYEPPCVDLSVGC